jgi:hypothetical protein
VNARVIDVFLDGSRALPAEDPTGRAMRIAAGAATFNLRCAAAWMGYDTWLGLAPYAQEPDLVARIVLEPSDTPDRDLHDLYQQIPRRHTSRTPASSAPLSQDTRFQLTSAARQENTELAWLQEADQGALTRMMIDTDLREIHDWQRTAERAHWVGGARTIDGVPSDALGPRPTTYPAAIRDLGTAPKDRTRPRSTFEEDPALAVLSTEGDDPADQLAAGIALERILLVATREGVVASFLNQLLEFDDLRRAVQRRTGRPGFAQMVIRFGHGPRSAGTPRRPVPEFVRTSSSGEES